MGKTYKADNFSNMDGTPYQTSIVNVSPVIEMGASFSLSNSHNGNVIIITASCTVTIPSGLAAGFECSLITLAGVTLTVSLGASVTLFNNAGLTMAEKLSFTLKNRTAADQYITCGNI